MTQGGQTVSCVAHNHEIVGSTPTPALWVGGSVKNVGGLIAKPTGPEAVATPTAPILPQ